jgi:hypothetical protein
MAIETTYLQRDGLSFAKVTQAAGNSIKATSVPNIGTSATAIPGTSLTNRRRLYIKNVDTTTFYIGASNVSTTDGYPVRQFEEVVLDVASVSVYAISGSSATAKVLEIA